METLILIIMRGGFSLSFSLSIVIKKKSVLYFINI